MPSRPSTPVPTFVSPPVPEIAPAKVVLVLSLPAVNVAEPSVTAPPLASCKGTNRLIGAIEVQGCTGRNAKCACRSEHIRTACLQSACIDGCRTEIAVSSKQRERTTANLGQPPEPEIPPEKAVLVLSLPVVSVAEPSVTKPLPASDPIDWLKLLRSRVAPGAIVNALLGENASATPD